MARWSLKRLLGGIDRSNTPVGLRTPLWESHRQHVDLIDGRTIDTSDRGSFTETAQFYYDLICESAPYLKDRPTAATDVDRARASIANNRIVCASWGLIARGSQALPLAARLTSSRDPDLREAGASVFCGLRDPDVAESVINEVLAALEHEPQREVIDALIAALGQLRSRKAIPMLSRIIMDDDEDGDTRHEAALSLGRIVRRRFEKDGADPIAGALRWLETHPDSLDS